MEKHKKKNILLWVVLIVPYLLFIPAVLWHFSSIDRVQNSSFIIINKADLTLKHYNCRGQLLQESRVATGKGVGNKADKGDMKTPEGVFRIAGIENSIDWKHDFKDDTLGEIANAYGPFFIRLDVPGQRGIGIHGTVDDNSIGTRASEGCIRMHNDDLRNLVEKIKTACVVVITPGIDDVNYDKRIADSLAKRPDPLKKVVKKSR